MKNPEVSILIPCFNREKFVDECIQSALDQTYDDFEIVIVDNASTDRTWEICQKFSSKDKRVRTYQNKHNIGPVQNWKRCIGEAKGKYGKILFSDDMMASTFLEKCLPFIEKPDVGFVFSAVKIGENTGLAKGFYHWRKATGLYLSKDFIADAIFGSLKVPVSPGAALFRLQDLKDNLLTNIPSPSYSDFSEHGAGPDLWLYLGAAKNYPKVGFVDEHLMFFRAHASSITISSPQKIVNRYRQARIYYASQFLDRASLDQLLIVEWLREIMNVGSLRFSYFCRRYLPQDDIPRFNVLCSIKVFVKVLLHHFKFPVRF